MFELLNCTVYTSIYKYNLLSFRIWNYLLFSPPSIHDAQDKNNSLIYIFCQLFDRKNNDRYYTIVVPTTYTIYFMYLTFKVLYRTRGQLIQSFVTGLRLLYRRLYRVSFILPILYDSIVIAI